MPIDPEQITTAGLPRHPLGGFREEPTAELLKLVAWDYREARQMHRSLAQEVEELRVRVAELEAREASLQAELDARKRPDEAARVLLTMAQRQARELREATRSECEGALRKARTRAEAVERERVRRGREDAQQTERARGLKRELASQLRAALTKIAAADAPPRR